MNILQLLEKSPGGVIEFEINGCKYRCNLTAGSIALERDGRDATGWFRDTYLFPEMLDAILAAHSRESGFDDLLEAAKVGLSAADDMLLRALDYEEVDRWEHRVKVIKEAIKKAKGESNG